MKKSFKIISMITLMSLLLNCSAVYGKTVTPAVPNYEVKIFMDPSVVLNSNNELKSNVLNTFNMPNSVTKMSVEFLDSDNLALNNYGWNVRLRKTEGEDNFELNYKKRYAIENGDIDSALQTAAKDGFDINEQDYAAQIEWGYQKQTLSLSNVKNASISGYNGMELPSAKDARNAAASKVPGKLNNNPYSDFGKSILKDAHIYGPVTAKRSIGVWNGEKFYIEVWKIKNSSGNDYEYVVEASFKTDNRSEAKTKHDTLISYLKDKGWLLPVDQLKTQMILDRY